MARGNLTADEVLAKMVDIVRILRRSIQEGVAGTHYDDRVLGHQSGSLQIADGRRAIAGGRRVEPGRALRHRADGGQEFHGRDRRRADGGRCAALPGACIAVAEEMGLSEEMMAKALLGQRADRRVHRARWTFAAEVGGCQAEGGAAACMAAAALVTLAEGTLAQAVAAASMALQSMIGLVCDPVANRVEVPCLGKNVMAASNAIACANMALAGYDPVIPLDEVIETARRVGEQLPRELRCTALGGLSITPTSKLIELKLSACRRREIGY